MKSMKILLVIAVFWFAARPAVAEELPLATLIPIGKSRIPGLTWVSKKPKIVIREEAGKRGVYVLLRGRYSDKKKKLMRKDWVVPRSSDGRFGLRIHMTSKYMRVRLIAVGKGGKRTFQLFEIRLPELISILEKDPRLTREESEWSSRTTAPPVQSPILQIEPREIQRAEIPSEDVEDDNEVGIQLFLGGSAIDYQEVNYGRVYQISTFARARLLFPLSRRWELIGSAAGLLFPVVQDQKSVTLHQVDLETLAVSNIPIRKTPWQVRVFGGLQFAAQFVPGDAYGYSSLLNPIIYPAIGRTFDNGIMTELAAWYFPIGSLSNFGKERKFGGRLSAEYPLEGGTSLRLEAEFLHVRFNLSDPVLSTSEIFQLAVGYGF